MTRLLLLSVALLISSSLACAPHSPRRPRPKPVEKPKECTEFTNFWTPPACTAGAKFKECVEPTVTKTKFTCAKGNPVANTKAGVVTIETFTCDTETGKWKIKDKAFNKEETKEEFEARAMEVLYMCAVPN